MGPLNTNFNGIPPLGVPPQISQETEVPLSPVVSFLQRVVDTLNEDAVIQDFHQREENITLQSPVPTLDPGKPPSLLEVAMIISLAIQSLQEMIREADRADIDRSQNTAADQASQGGDLIEEATEQAVPNNTRGLSDLIHSLERNYLPFHASFLPAFQFSSVSMSQPEKASWQGMSEEREKAVQDALTQKLAGMTLWELGGPEKTVKNAFEMAKAQGPFTSEAAFLQEVKKNLTIDESDKDAVMASIPPSTNATPFEASSANTIKESLLDRLPFSDGINQAMQNTLALGPYATTEGFLAVLNLQLGMQMGVFLTSQQPDLFGISSSFQERISSQPEQLTENFGLTFAKELMQGVQLSGFGSFAMQSLYSSVAALRLQNDLGVPAYRSQQIALQSLQNTLARGPFATDEAFTSEYQKQLGISIASTFAERFFDPIPVSPLRVLFMQTVADAALKSAIAAVASQFASSPEEAFLYQVQVELGTQMGGTPSNSLLELMAELEFNALVTGFQNEFGVSQETATRQVSNLLAANALGQSAMDALTANYGFYQAAKSIESLNALLNPEFSTQALELGLGSLLAFNQSLEHLSGFSLPMATLVNLAENIVQQTHLHQALVSQQNEQISQVIANPDQSTEFNAQVDENNQQINALNEQRQQFGLPPIAEHEQYQPNLSLLAAAPTVQEMMGQYFVPVKQAALALLTLAANGRQQQTALAFLAMQNPAFIYPQNFIQSLPPFFLGTPVQTSALGALVAGLGSVDALGRGMLSDLASRFDVSLSPAFYSGVQLMLLKTIQNVALYSALPSLALLGGEALHLNRDSPALAIALSLSFATRLADFLTGNGIQQSMQTLLQKETPDTNPAMLASFTTAVNLALMQVAVTRLTQSLQLTGLLSALMSNVHTNGIAPNEISPLQNPIVQLYLKQALVKEMIFSQNLNGSIAALLANQAVNQAVVDGTDFPPNLQEAAALFLQAEQMIPYLSLALPAMIERQVLVQTLLESAVFGITETSLNAAVALTLAAGQLQTLRDFFLQFTFDLRMQGVSLQDAVALSQLAVQFFAGGKTASDVALEELDANSTQEQIREALVNHIVGLLTNDVGLTRATLLAHQVAIALLGAVQGEDFDADPVAHLKALLKLLQQQLAALLSGQPPRISNDDEGIEPIAAGSAGGLINPDPDLSFLLQQMLMPSTTLVDSFISGTEQGDMQTSMPLPQSMV